ncbi:hypothetical protein [Streptomyces sp. NPDC059894]|uniref:hypothetical protein n=1 Tax=unclassified Streptomyces TaxID=2593676 RepID=UPI003653959B
MRNLLLLPLYFLLFVPVSLVVRVVHDPLRRAWLPAADHYWHYRSPSVEVTGDGAHASRAVR